MSLKEKCSYIIIILSRFFCIYIHVKLPLKLLLFGFWKNILFRNGGCLDICQFCWKGVIISKIDFLQNKTENIFKILYLFLINIYIKYLFTTYILLSASKLFLFLRDNRRNSKVIYTNFSSEKNIRNALLTLLMLQKIPSVLLFYHLL